VTHDLQSLRTTAFAFFIVTIAGVAAAEQVRVVRDGATIWRQASATGGILTVARSGTILEVDRHEGRWLVVHLPSSPAERGYILEQQTQPIDPADAASASPTTAPPAGQARGPAPVKRQARESFVYLGASMQTTSDGFVAVTTSPKYAEQEVRTTTYGTAWRPGFEIGGGTWITPEVSIAVLVTRRQLSQSASISAQIPHPFFYNQPRTLTGQTTANRADTSLHVQIGYSAVNVPHLQVILAGGPSYSWVQQDLLDQLNYTDVYPYDTVTFTGATMRTETAHGLRGNVDGTVLVPLSRAVAIQGSVRYLFGTVSFATAGVPPVTGSGQVGVGVRLRF
jgi:hypothetical protein